MRCLRSAKASSCPIPRKSGEARTFARMLASRTATSSQIDSMNTTEMLFAQCSLMAAARSDTERRLKRVELVASKMPMSPPSCNQRSKLSKVRMAICSRFSRPESLLVLKNEAHAWSCGTAAWGSIAKVRRFCPALKI
eukprot:Lithocolla_globosa_v1_NODE_3424_length_1674_cov_4.945028.p2 type:complete len:138 gc:universal NODE_3424_length_1674_cov_4.945028:713-300(-)